MLIGTKITSSWSLPLGDAPFSRHDADDDERHAAHEDVFADRAAAVGKQRFRHRAAEHDDGGILLHVVGVEELPFGHRPIASRGKVFAGALRRSLIIEVAVTHREPAAALGQGGFDIGQRLDRGGVVGHQRGDIAGVADAGGAGPDQHQIGPEGADAVENFLPAAFAHRQHGDHGGDADDDAEQRKHGPKDVDAQRAPGGDERFLHARHQADGAFEAAMVCRANSLCGSSATIPVSSRIRPSWMRTMRLACCATFSAWVIRMIVRPSA